MDSNERKIVEKIANKYKEKSLSKVDELKALDKKVKKSPSIFAYFFGTIGALILGAGMSIILEEIVKNAMVIGLILGIIGLIIVSVNYFIYRVLLRKSKNKYAKQIEKLSDELLNTI